MFKSYYKITIVHSTKPRDTNLNEILQWFGSSLGLFSVRDKDRSNFRIFIELLKAAKHNKDLSSDEIAENLQLSRGTVVHHLNKLIDAGIAVSRRNRYTLRVEKLTYLVDEIEKDVTRALTDLKEMAKDIDARLGL